MKSNERNNDLLEHIVKYCDEIYEAQVFFGNSLEVFQANTIYRNAVAMCVLQIGELSGHLTDDFKDYYSGVPWRNIKGMRNIMAHRYGNIDVPLLWEAINIDLPMLSDYCKSILRENSETESSDGDGLDYD
jgi:uncharacterized protein with HEPN domain